MSVRQYIGARYVMKIYENSVDPSTADWEANTHYEPLTMVTYNGSSYLSKKEVPNTVGDPVTNSSYWAFWGSTSGQIAQLQQRISDVEDFDRALHTVKNRKFIFFGDSYGETYTSGSGVVIRGWLDRVVDVLGLSADQYAGSYAYSGYGFLANNTPWLTKVNALADDPTVTDIVFLGGHNDAAYAVTYPSLETYIADTIDACKTKFVNAHIWVGYCSFDTDSNIQDKLCKSIYERVATANGATFMNGIEYVVFNPNNILNHAHPNNDGTQAIASALASILTGGECYNGIPWTDVNILLKDSDANVNATSMDTLRFNVENDHLSITAPFVSTNGLFNISFGSSGYPLAANMASYAILGKHTNLPLYPKQGSKILGSITGMAAYRTLGNFNATLTIVSSNEYLLGYLLAIDSNGQYVNTSGSDDLLAFRGNKPNFTLDLLR